MFSFGVLILITLQWRILPLEAIFTLDITELCRGYPITKNHIATVTILVFPHDFFEKTFLILYLFASTVTERYNIIQAAIQIGVCSFLISIFRVEVEIIVICNESK